jgi:hypothetical protein
MARHDDQNPFNEEEEVNPFSSPGRLAHARSINSRLSPEPVRFPYGHDATIDVPIDTSKRGQKFRELQIKEKELQKKEAELTRREEEVKRKEEALARAGILLEVRNWPPFLPIIHHDIANEIPVYLQKLQYVAFSTFLGMHPLLDFNLTSLN